MTPEVIVALVAALGSLLGGGALVNAIANRQTRRSEARTKAAEGEVAQSKEAREWAGGFRSDLAELRKLYDRDRTLALTCPGAAGEPCPTRVHFLAQALAPDPAPAEKGPGTAT